MSALLPVPGATLSYVCVGSGPLLLLISGGNGSKIQWLSSIPFLSSHFTVCAYDRRGFSSSPFTGHQDFSMPARVQRDADDAGALIAHLSPNKPAYVLGSSSGAIVALETFERHHEKIKLLVAHEPPLRAALVEKLGEGGWRKEAESIGEKVYRGYSENGLDWAIGLFGSHFTPKEDGVWLANQFRSHLADAIHWYEHEVRQYVRKEVKWDLLRANKDKLRVVLGEETTGSGGGLIETTPALAKLIGVEMGYFPGGHVVFATRPKAFAEALLELLRS